MILVKIFNNLCAYIDNIIGQSNKRTKRQDNKGQEKTLIMLYLFIGISKDMQMEI
jgi:hypothetical protein